MKKIITTLVALIVMYFVADRVGYIIIQWAYNHSASDAKLKIIVQKTNADIVLMGSSKTEDHFIPQIFEDSLGMSTYNCGMVGCMDIYYQYALLNLMLERQKPKIVLLELGNNAIDKSKRLSSLAPFIGIAERTDSVFMDLDMYYDFQLSHCYRYNESLISTIGWMGKEIAPDSNKGFVEQKSANYELRLDSVTDYSKNELAMLYYNRFAEVCKSHGIRLVFYAPPYYAKCSEHIYDHLQDIISKNNIIYIDYQTKGYYLDKKEYWHDELHMSGKGAQEFSSLVAHDLKGITENLKK